MPSSAFFEILSLHDINLTDEEMDVLQRKGNSFGQFIKYRDALTLLHFDNYEWVVIQEDENEDIVRNNSPELTKSNINKLGYEIETKKDERKSLFTKMTQISPKKSEKKMAIAP